MRILVVEDNRDILVNIVDYLTLKGFVVDAMHNGATALVQATKAEYDLIVLDLSLPGLDGVELCRRLRREQSMVPVIMLTARDTLDDKLQGFDAGADDYLVKPFALSELLSRIQAVLKRSQQQLVRTLQVADLEMDLNTLQVQRGGQLINLNPKCFKLLETLMKQSPKVVSRDTLTNQLWADDPPDSNGLKSHIYLLRSQIDKPFDRPLLHTVHGVGYKLAERHD